MKIKTLILAIALVVVVTGAFAFRKQSIPSGVKPMTVVSVHFFTPGDKTKPVMFLGVNIESYKEDGSFVHRQVSNKGVNRFFYGNNEGIFSAIKSENNKQTQTIADLTPEVAQQRAQRKDVPLSGMAGFKGVENVHGLPLSVVEFDMNGTKYKQWSSPAHGSIQMEREVNDGMEQIKIVSVTDGYNPDEFARIPDYPKAPKQ